MSANNAVHSWTPSLLYLLGRTDHGGDVAFIGTFSHQVLEGYLKRYSNGKGLKFPVFRVFWEKSYCLNGHNFWSNYGIDMEWVTYVIDRARSATDSMYDKERSK